LLVTYGVWQGINVTRHIIGHLGAHIILLTDYTLSLGFTAVSFVTGFVSSYSKSI